MWAWAVTGVGLVILAVEVVSRFRPVMEIQATHLFILIVLIAGGLGLMLRGYVEDKRGGKAVSDRGTAVDYFVISPFNF